MPFNRKTYYLEPPSANASVAEWNAWLKADELKARADKARHTKGLKFCALPDDMGETQVRRVGGVWKQSTAIGISGSEDEGYFLDTAVEPEQEKILGQKQYRRAKRSGSSARKNRAKRMKK